MKNLDLLTDKELPGGFNYPKQFNHIVDLGLTDLEPWYVLQGKPLREMVAGLSQRYPDRKLVPFARRQDNDDIACWQSGSGDEVFIIHDFASVGWEQRDHFSSFYEWLRRTIEDLIEFDS
jgi:hypothetical protein